MKGQLHTPDGFHQAKNISIPAKEKVLWLPGLVWAQ